MGRIILVRHGESEANRAQRFTVTDDSPLTERGREQAQAAAELIPTRFRPVQVLSSEFLRARQTSEIIARHLGLPVEVIADMHERNFGCLRGEPYSRFLELRAEDPLFEQERHWMWAPQGGESREQVRLRIKPVLDRVRERFPDDDVLLVCHGAVMGCAWAHFTASWDEVHVPDNCGMVVVPHDGVTFSTPEVVEACGGAPQHDSEASVTQPIRAL